MAPAQTLFSRKRKRRSPRRNDEKEGGEITGKKEAENTGAKVAMKDLKPKKEVKEGALPIRKPP